MRCSRVVGFVLLVWGYGQARLDPVVLWNPPGWMRHVAALLTLPAFVLVVAGNMRGTRMKAALGHPMVLGVKLWAFAHLIANGTLAVRRAVRKLPGLGDRGFRVVAPPRFRARNRLSAGFASARRAGGRRSAWSRGSRSRSGCTACSSVCDRSDETFRHPVRVGGGRHVRGRGGDQSPEPKSARSNRKDLRAGRPLPAEVQNYTSYDAALMTAASASGPPRAALALPATPSGKAAFASAGVE